MSTQPQLHAYIRDKIVNTQFFKTDINEFNIVACFGIETYGELTKYIFKKYVADVAILVDLKSKTVYITMVDGSKFKLETFIKLFCNGSSKDNVAKGVITEKFLQFTKKFKPC